MAKKNKSKSNTSKNKSTARSVTPPSSKSKSALPSFFHNTKMNCWLIMAFSFVIYAGTLFHDYTQDDAIVIYDNMFTTQGVAGIPGILKYDTFYGFFKKEGKANLVAGGRYRPLTLVMYALEVQLFSKKKKDATGKVVFDPLEEKEKRNAIKFIGHLITVLLYGLTGVVLYLLLLMMLRPVKGEDFALFVSLLTTFIFIAHPIHTEVVANIKGRDEIVTLLGSLAALYFSLKGYYQNLSTNGTGSKYQIGAGVLFFLALMAKENAITFLAIVPLTYYFFTKADFGKIATQMIPFGIAAFAFLGIRFSILGADFGSDVCNELMNCPYLKVEGGKYIPYSGGEKMATIFYTLGEYVKLLFFPHPLTHDYYPYHVGIMNFGDWRVLVSLFMYLGLGVYAVMGLLKKDILAYGILFYLITLSIVSNIVFPVGTNMAERFAFMPSVGFSFVLAVLGFRLVKYLAKNKKKLQPNNFTTTLGIAAVVLLLFSAKTFSRNQVWKSDATLFLNDVEISSNSAKLRNSAGGTLVQKAASMPEGTARTNIVNEAIGHLTQAIKIHPNYKNAYLLLGNAHQYINQFDQSIQYYQNALRLDSDYEEAFKNMTIAYRSAGRFFGEKQGNPSKAIQYLEIANQRQANDPETLRLLGIASGITGNGAKAVQYLEQAAKLEPENASVLWNLASALGANGQVERANQLREKALKIDPTIGQGK